MRRHTIQDLVNNIAIRKARLEDLENSNYPRTSRLYLIRRSKLVNGIKYYYNKIREHGKSDSLVQAVYELDQQKSSNVTVRVKMLERFVNATPEDVKLVIAAKYQNKNVKILGVENITLEPLELK